MKQTVLNQAHRDLGARMVEFGGWDMPVQYTNLIEEHHAVRKRAGLFDVSHMGEFDIKGAGSFELIQKVVSKNIEKMTPGMMVLGVMCNELGGILDDLTVYKFADDHYWLVVNAGTKDKDLAWIREAQQIFNIVDVEINDLTDDIAKLDLQGPLSFEILKKLLSKEDGEKIAALTFYRFAEVTIDTVPVVISQSGYTGEYGFEIYMPTMHALKIWNLLIEKGRPWGLVPAGLGARDTLRTECAMMLYGHELDENISPLDCVYGFAVSFEKDFLGRQGLFQQKDRGLTKKLVGFEMIDRQIARSGYTVHRDGHEIGWVTSGTPSPTLGKNIGMAYVKPEYAVMDSEIEIKVRDSLARARIVKMPFYKRK